MSAKKRQQTFAKLQREQAVREKRARKQERRQDARAAKAAAAQAADGQPETDDAVVDAQDTPVDES